MTKIVDMKTLEEACKKKKVDLRKMLAEEFVKALEEMKDKDQDDISLWETPWFTGSRPQNGITKRPYRGVNAVWLRVRAVKRGTNDPRWYTFNQIADVKGYAHKGQKWHLKKGSSGEWVEHWSMYDFTEKKFLRNEEEERAAKDADHNIGPVAKHYKVFNGADIEGIEPWQPPKADEEIKPDDAVYKIAAGMGVTFLEDQLDRAYYVPNEDVVHLPKRENFKTCAGFNATALHELAHSTGHEKRLNREIKNTFGDEKYAFEELIAEITSCFASELLETPLTNKEFDNSKKYVESWISGIKEKPSELAKAINAAEKAADYMEDAMK